MKQGSVVLQPLATETFRLCSGLGGQAPWCVEIVAQGARWRIWAMSRSHLPLR